MPERAKKRPARDRDLTARLWAALGELDMPGVRAIVSGGVAHLRGTVDSKSSVAEAQRVAQSVDGIKSVRSDLKITDPAERAQIASTTPIVTKDPTDTFSLVGSNEVEADVADDLRGDEISPFAESLPTISEEVAAGTKVEFNADIGASDSTETVDDSELYAAPTDPIVRPISRTDGDIRIVGGFARDSLEPSIEEAVNGDVDEPERLQRDDSEIAEDVRLALEEDSATADLPIILFVREGIVFLRGEVASLDDIESAEEIASRVPGVIEVREELEIEVL